MHTMIENIHYKVFWKLGVIERNDAIMNEYHFVQLTMVLLKAMNDIKAKPLYCKAILSQGQLGLMR